MSQLSLPNCLRATWIFRGSAEAALRPRKAGVPDSDVGCRSSQHRHLGLRSEDVDGVGIANMIPFGIDPRSHLSDLLYEHVPICTQVPIEAVAHPSSIVPDESSDEEVFVWAAGY